MATLTNQPKLTGIQWIERIVLGLLFVLLGTLIIVVFSPYRPVFRGSLDTVGRLVLIVILFTASILSRRLPFLRRYWELLFGLFMLALAISLDWWVAGFLQRIPYLSKNSPSAFAIEKIKSAAIAALIVLMLTKISGRNLGSVYVQKGKLLNSLTIGLIAFFVAAAGAIPMSQLLFSGQPIKLTDVVQWLPWLLIFVFGNAFFEELLFRGLFLRKLEPFFGKAIANGLIVFVFTGLHLGVTYTRDQLLFLVILVPLAYLWGFIIQKTDTIWGSVLFHAGMDLPIVIALFSSL